MCLTSSTSALTRARGWLPLVIPACYGRRPAFRQRERNSRRDAHNGLTPGLGKMSTTVHFAEQFQEHDGIRLSSRPAQKGNNV